MGKKSKNKYYAYITKEGRGIVSSWPECEARVKGRRASFRGFLDRVSAQRWLESEGRAGGGGGGGKKKFYAYRTEGTEGIVDSWAECESRVHGHKARYRGFPDRASAQQWLDGGAQYESKASIKAEALSALPADAVFFDSGTGPGRGVELRVTDRDGASMVHLAGELPEGTELTEEGNLLLGGSRTNNYGELLACYLALKIASERGAKHIFGDSKLVLDYWSKGLVSKEKRLDDPDLAALAKRTATARKQFEKQGGEIEHVSGGINPADLGYHRD